MFQKIDGLVERIKEEFANGSTITFVDDMDFSYEVTAITNDVVTITLEENGKRFNYSYNGEYLEMDDGNYLHDGCTILIPCTLQDGIEIISPEYIMCLQDDYSINVTIY